MRSKQFLLSGRVPVTNVSNVPSDRYSFLHLSDAEPNLGTANANGWVLVYDTQTPGRRLWSNKLISSYDHANSGFAHANAGLIHANAAFIRANNSLDANNGGTVTGDVRIQGNLTVNGVTTYVNTQTVLVADNIITLNAAINQSSAPVSDAGIEVDRGSSPNVYVLWNESIDKWTVTNNGTGYYGIGSDAAESYANSAFIKSNSSFNHANAAFDFANTLVSGGAADLYARAQANSAFNHANASYIRANNSLNANVGGNVTGDVIIVGNLTSNTLTTTGSNGSITGANAIFSNYFFGANGTVDLYLYTTNAFANANAGLTKANAAFDHANASFTRTNSAFAHANAGFIHANSAYQSQNATGNTANAAFTVANGAFIHANSAYQSQNATGQYANAAFIHANSAYESQNATGQYANAAFIHANSAYQSQNATGQYANAAFIQANAGFAHANSAYESQNATGQYANAAFTVANGAFIHANASFDHVNASFAHANSAYQSQNATGQYANAAFTVANGAFIHANSGFIQANSSYDHANAAYISQNATGQYANAAFLRANNSLDANNGGTVTANVIIAANLTTQNVFVRSYIDLNTAPSAPPRNEGRIFYDNDQKALSYNNESDNTIQLGQETVIRVWNNSGTTIARGKVARIGGDASANGFPAVALAAADVAGNAEVVGVTSTTIANNDYGYVTIHGKIRGLNTSLLTAGQELFLSDTPGEYQTTPPASPSVPMAIGYVTLSDVTDGSILVYSHLMEGKNKTNGAILFGRNGAIDQDPTKLYWDYVNNRLGIDTDNPQANLHVAGDGLFTGNVTITGNLVISNAQTITTDQLFVGGNDIVLNANVTGSPVLNAAIIVNRGTSPNAYILWDETVNEWIAYEGTGEPGHILLANKTANSWSVYDNFQAYEKEFYPIGANLANSVNEHAKAGFETANIAQNLAIASFKHANSGFIHANSSYDHANAAYLSQNATGQYANAAFIHANSAYQSQNATGQYANAAFIHANSAYDAINNLSAIANTTNTTIIAVSDHANAAFNVANAAYQSQNATGQYANAAFIHANSAFNYQNATASYANSGFIQANAAFAAQNTTASYTNSAFTQANAAFIHANSAYDYANTLAAGAAIDNVARSTANSAGIYANGAFLHANSAFIYQNATASYANSGLIQANAAFDHANAAFAAANNVFPQIQPAFNTANAAFIQANAAFDKANNADANALSAGVYANKAFNTANAGFIQANSGFGHANSAFNHANAGFIQANAAIVHAQSAFDAQNTTGSYANSAFIQSNAAFNHANSGFIQANSSYNHANSAYESQNATGQYANAAFVRANNSLNANTGGQVTGDVSITGNLTVIGQTVYANTQTVLIGDNIITLNAAINQSSAPTMNAGIEVDRGSSANVYILWNESTQAWQFTNDGVTYENFGGGAAGVYANGAFIQANASFNTGNAAFIKANASYDHANAAFEKANTAAVDTWVRNQANSGFNQANASFNHANAAFEKANTAAIDTWVRNQANGAYDHANSAYAKANTTANGTILSLVTTGDGVTSTFALGFNPIASNSAITVSIGGIVQTEDLNFSINPSNSTISFSSPPPAGETIRAAAFSGITPYFLDVANSAGAVIEAFNGLGNGVTTTFNLGFNPVNANTVTVAIGGVIQPDSAYTVSNVANTITFDTAPGNNENIRVTGFSKVNPYYREISVINSNVTVSVFETTANGSANTFALGFDPQAKETLIVTIDGIVQPLATYSVNRSSNTITFVEAPVAGENVRVATFYTTIDPYYIQLQATNTTVSTFETTANGLVSTFNMGFMPVSNQALTVAIDGVLQAPSTYTINSLANTITFLTTPSNNEYISVVTIGATNVYVVNDGTIEYVKLHPSVRSAVNTSFDSANSAGSYANSAFNTANSAATTGKAIAMSIVFGG